MVRIYTYDKLFNNDKRRLRGEFRNYDFINSKIISCTINNIEFNKLKYISIRNYIYTLINDISIVCQHSNNLFSEEKYVGYNYIKELNIYMTYTNNNFYNLMEIINQAIENNININLQIRLMNGSIIKLSY